MGRVGRTPCSGIAIACASSGPIPIGTMRSPSRSLSRSSGVELGGAIPRPATTTSIIGVATVWTADPEVGSVVARVGYARSRQTTRGVAPLLQLQKSAVDPAFFRSVTDLEVF